MTVRSQPKALDRAPGSTVRRGRAALDRAPGPRSVSSARPCAGVDRAPGPSSARPYAGAEQRSTVRRGRPCAGAAPGPILRTRRNTRAPHLRTGAHSERRVPNGGGEFPAEDSSGVSGVRAGGAAGRRWGPKSGLSRDPRRVAGGLGPGQRGKGQSRWALAALQPGRRPWRS